MEVRILHLSDIHFAPGGHEKKPAFRPFLADLEAQLARDVPTYLFLSGDVAFAGGQPQHYESLVEKLGPALDDLGISRRRRVCVPGNHDVSTKVIEDHLLAHEAVVASRFSEDQYNDFIEKASEPFRDKFKNYLAFQSEFADYGITLENLGGCGHSLPEGIGVFCANTAFFSSGAAKKDGQRVSDEGRLAIPTRAMAAWLEQSPNEARVFVGHHPASWLNNWSKSELRRFAKRFGLILTGHMHEQDVFHSIEFGSSVVQLAAPALLTEKRSPMGYAVVSMCTERGPLSVKYRQWGQRSKFVLGTMMADDDRGIVEFESSRRLPVQDPGKSFILRFYESGLEKALQAFGRDPGLWVEPVIKTCSETDRNRSSARDVGLREILASTASLFVKAPPQYGLTCLSWMICREATRVSGDKVWLRVDLAATKPHKVREDLNAQLKTFGKVPADIACIVVDSWTTSMHNSVKCLEAISKEFPGKRMVVMETDDRPAIDVAASSVAGTSFEQLYLWALSRSGLRQVVRSYCVESGDVEDLEQILSKVVGDLGALNLPRTALNCLTLLMVSELEYDDAPINRAEVIRRILNLIFSSEVSLTYRSRADMKDCEHLLGYFAEKIVKDADATFTRDQFLSVGAAFCEKMLVDLDVKGVLSILVNCGVIVEDGGRLRFRFSYWVYYFAALRMHHDKAFAEYILSDMQYARFPEVMEFYTGFDRRRVDAVQRLEKDLTSLCDKIEEKCGLSSPAELFAVGRWDPSEEDVDRMRAEIEERVIGSSLPVEIKDQFADRAYDPARPYDQAIQSLMQAYSFDNLTAGVSAASRALRNSDFVGPEDKRRLLSVIMRCWEQIQTVLVLIAPSLAKTGRASFDGTNFVIAGDTPSDREGHSVGKIWSVIPHNVLTWFRGDIASAKMGPLLYSVLASEKVALTRHNVATLVMTIRPKGWRSVIENYIADVDKNSFFLMDTFGTLEGEYKYEVLTDRAKADVGDMVKMSIAKHEKGSKRPSAKLIGKYQIQESVTDVGGD